MYISRFDNRGRSIAHKIYKGVENGSINVVATMISNNLRLDQIAYKYYNEGMNAWIIAAASGIRWQLGIGQGFNGANLSLKEPVLIIVPDIRDVIALKQG